MSPKLTKNGLPLGQSIYGKYANVQASRKIGCIGPSWVVRTIGERARETKQNLLSHPPDSPGAESRNAARAHHHTVKKVIVFPVPSRDVINQTLPGRELLIYSSGRVWLVTSRLGTGKTITFYFIIILIFFGAVGFFSYFL